MLRRVSRVLRVLLLALGVALLLWLPASMLLAFEARRESPRHSSGLYSSNGEVTFWTGSVLYPDPGILSAQSTISIRLHDDSFGLHALLMPRYQTVQWATPDSNSSSYSRSLSVPLLLLAFLCLVWPVTSFVIARRRRGTRGFEVEAKGIDAVSTVDS